MLRNHGGRQQRTKKAAQKNMKMRKKIGKGTLAFRLLLIFNFNIFSIKNYTHVLFLLVLVIRVAHNIYVMYSGVMEIILGVRHEDALLWEIEMEILVGDSMRKLKEHEDFFESGRFKYQDKVNGGLTRKTES